MKQKTFNVLGKIFIYIWVSGLFALMMYMIIENPMGVIQSFPEKIMWILFITPLFFTLCYFIETK